MSPNVHWFAGQDRAILTCNGANRRQAFSLGNHLIGYGETDEQAIENLKAKEQLIKWQRQYAAQQNGAIRIVNAINKSAEQRDTAQPRELPSDPRASSTWKELQEAYDEGRQARRKDPDGSTTEKFLASCPYTSPKYAFAWHRGYSDEDYAIGEQPETDYKAHAQRLAEALKEIIDEIPVNPKLPLVRKIVDIACKAYEQWEAAQ